MVVVAIIADRFQRVYSIVGKARWGRYTTWPRLAKHIVGLQILGWAMEVQKPRWSEAVVWRMLRTNRAGIVGVWVKDVSFPNHLVRLL